MGDTCAHTEDMRCGLSFNLYKARKPSAAQRDYAASAISTPHALSPRATPSMKQGQPSAAQLGHAASAFTTQLTLPPPPPGYALRRHADNARHCGQPRQPHRRRRLLYQTIQQTRTLPQLQRLL
jgi:hypothetical protein